MGNQEFWDWFEQTAAPRLGLRETTFRKAFQYLDGLQLTGPVTIVETGCTRQAGNWEGDGQSTVLFDRYLAYCAPGSHCFSIDIDPAATAQCKALVSDRVAVFTSDSVLALREIGRSLRQQGRTVDFLYLDSFDVDWSHTTPSAVHHLKELVSIVPSLRRDTLVMVDDCPPDARVVPSDTGGYVFLAPPQIGGKGRLVAEYAAQVGATSQFFNYQAAWTGLV